MIKTATPTMIDETKRLLIAAGAAVAAGGGGHLKNTLAALMQADVPREKMALALSIGRCVKERPAQHMMSVADILVETQYGVDGALGCNADNIESTALCQKTVLLVSAGAAMAANCEPCLNTLVPRLIEVGVSSEDIRTAVTIGKETQDAIADDTWSTAMAVLQLPGAENLTCGCSSTPCSTSGK